MAVGMMTPVGIGASQTATSVRAGISRQAESSIYNKRFQPMKMALLPDDALPPLEASLESVVGLTTRQARMVRLAAPALQEVLAKVSNSAEVPVLVGTPEPLPGRTDPAGDKFLEYLGRQSGCKFNSVQSKTFPFGRSAGVFALKEGLRRLQSTKAQYVVVGGVDTYLDLYLLGTLDMEERILADGVMDGFVPGEGAAFLLLSSDPKHSSDKELLGYVTGVATGIEKGHRYSEEVYRGDGLSNTVQELFSDVPSSATKVNTVFAGFNGESFWAKEWGVTYLRNKERFNENIRVQHPADCFGDAGAALAPLMLGLGAIGMHKRYLNGPCLVWASSDREERGAALIQNGSN